VGTPPLAANAEWNHAELGLAAAGRYAAPLHPNGPSVFRGFADPAA
jgi:hypothetical protein